ncbi:G-protein coupled receptor Mth2-like isoform X2 [Linepithema humile]|uniref:G-protein coupled receptor Mth2-like isoform X2 n=1 Tax=Linepithema humile TaxID=83485 RepID=UPI00351DBD94
MQPFIYNVFMVASFLWQNVICFDILWTFRRFHSIQGNIKRRKMKMLVICSIYAWGTTGIYAIILTTINFASNIPKNLIQPKICVKQQGIAEEAKFAYFYIPVGIIIICNICFFIFTTLKIMYTKKDTDRYLKSLESKCHDNNKQRFIMYLKLFILMDTTTSIKWTMETVARNFVDQLPVFIWFLVVMTCALQGFIIFVVFVCRKRIMQLLLKQFGYENSGLCCKNSKSNNCNSTSLQTSSTTKNQVRARNQLQHVNQLLCEKFIQKDQ